MASAGLRTVTNTFENKTADELTAISENLIPAQPSLAGVTAALRDAIHSAGDHELRVRSAAVRWPTRWEDSFDDEVVDRIISFLDSC
jgi:hypothetical protein